MRISIKYKLPLMILAVFVLFAAALYIYYKSYALENIRYKLDVSSQRLAVLNTQISKGIAERYPDMAAIEGYLDEVSIKKGIAISVYDSDGKLVFQSLLGKKLGHGFRTKDVSVIKGGMVYIVEVEHAYMLRNIFAMDIVQMVIRFAVASLFIILIPLVIYLHYDLVKPLELLRTRLAAVGYQSRNHTLKMTRKDEIGELSKNFDQMVTKLEASYDEQTEMITSISHDLKTPLTSVIGYVERLMEGKAATEEKRQEYYGIIYKKAQDIGNLLEEFSEYTRNEIECSAVAKELIAADEFFISIVREYEEELQAYGAKVSYTMDVQDNKFIEADVQKLRRVYANLISNAVKYTEVPLKLTLGCFTALDMVCFSLEDNGSGVPEAELDSIFGKFYRIEKSRSLERGGVGLGLAICKRIVENHGGSIIAYNNKDGGLGVRFCIPVVKK